MEREIPSDDQLRCETLLSVAGLFLVAQPGTVSSAEWKRVRGLLWRIRVFVYVYVSLSVFSALQMKFRIFQSWSHKSAKVLQKLI